MRRIIIFLLVVFISAPTLCSCGSKNRKRPEINTDPVQLDDICFAKTNDVTNYVMIEMTDHRYIIIELYPTAAPLTVGNFQKLVSEGFYDGIIFHRVVRGLLIQGGDPDGNGYGGSGKTVKGEFSANGVVNPLKHERGTVSMAHATNYNSASSQFFICCADNPSWDGQYAAFGKVIAGMSVADEISSVPSNAKGKPITDQVMLSVRFVNIWYPSAENDTVAGNDTAEEANENE